MSRRVTIYVPDDVAERLERESNASAYLAAAARRLMAVEATRDALVAGGYPEVPPEVVAEQARALAQEQRRRDDPELAARMRQRLSGYQRT